jgi:hypothetical protein
LANRFVKSARKYKLQCFRRTKTSKRNGRRDVECFDARVAAGVECRQLCGEPINLGFHSRVFCFLVTVIQLADLTESSFLTQSWMPPK